MCAVYARATRRVLCITLIFFHRCHRPTLTRCWRPEPEQYLSTRIGPVNQINKLRHAVALNYAATIKRRVRRQFCSGAIGWPYRPAGKPGSRRPQRARTVIKIVRRIQFFEVGDLTWCPTPVRNAITDYLHHAQNIFHPYRAIVPVLQRALKRAGAIQIVDLCSGAAGSWLHLLPALRETGNEVTVQMTDKYINRPALEHACAQLPGALTYFPQPVDATAMPESLHGFRTVFSAFHHFPPSQARAILADAVRHGQGIGVFEFTQRSYLGLRRAAAILPFIFFWAARIRPFRWSRLLLTWLIPIMPLIVTFESLVSSLRTYTPDELRGLAKAADPENSYAWETGEIPAEKSTVPVTYLLGYPKTSTAAPVADRTPKSIAH